MPLVRDTIEAETRHKTRVAMSPGLPGTLQRSVAWSWSAGQKAWARVQRGGREVWCTRKAPLLLGGSEVGGLEQALPCPHMACPCSCIGAVVPAQLPGWCIRLLHLSAGLWPRTFDQLAGTRLWNPGVRQGQGAHRSETQRGWM